MNNAPQSTSRVTRFLLPSVADLIFILLLAAFTYGALAPRLLWDGDIGWHIRDGQNILAAYAIPHADSFSATKSGQPWYAWEWLFDLLIAAVNNWLGLNGVVLAAGFIIAITFGLVFWISLRHGGTIPVTIVIFAVAVVASSIHFLARPHIISWLFAVLWFEILDRYDKQSSARAATSSLEPGAQSLKPALLWLLPVLMIAWVNLHGGFVLGFVLLGIFLVASFLNLVTGRSERRDVIRQVRNLGLTILACLVASLMNPYGYKLHAHVYEYLTNRFYMQHIDEFRAPNLHGLPAEFFVLLLALTAAGMFVARFRLRWSEWLLIAFSAFSGFWAARNIPIASLLLTLVAAPLFSRFPAAGEPRSRRLLDFRKLRLAEFEAGLRGHVWPLIFTIGTLLVCWNGGRLGGRALIDAHFDSARFPVNAVNALAARHDHEPIFSLDSWGGYLIYRRYPEQKVFIDDRHDFYGEPYLREYVKVLHVEPGWEQVLNDWGVHRAVLPAKSKLTDALRAAGWTVSYSDGKAVVFGR